ncbi:ComEA family DNA-binding protein [Actinotalea sp. AC32]|nr:ComEA family DNA-binding protein [Actinotalea sp. AC32]
MTGEEQVRRRLAELTPVAAVDADGPPVGARADGPERDPADRDPADRESTVQAAAGGDSGPDSATSGGGPVEGAPRDAAGSRPGAVDAQGLRHRALAAAASTYALTYGHPLTHDAPGRVRWGTSARVAGAAAGALALLTVVVVVRALAAAPATVVVPTTPPVLTSVERAAAPSAAPGPGTAPGSAGEAPTSGGPPERHDVVVVHVVGAVRSPGVVTLPTDARVVDAVDRAGGATEQADLAGVNLARTVVDGEQIAVPEVGASAGGDGDPGLAGPGTAAGPSAGTAGGAGATAALDVNAASAVELEALPGIGPVLAQRIVDHREALGPFAAVEDLAAVSGIGPAVLERLAGEVRVG